MTIKIVEVIDVFRYVMAKLGNDKMDIDSLMDMYSKDGVIAYDGKLNFH